MFAFRPLCQSMAAAPRLQMPSPPYTTSPSKTTVFPSTCSSASLASTHCHDMPLTAITPCGYHARMVHTFPRLFVLLGPSGSLAEFHSRNCRTLLFESRSAYACAFVKCHIASALPTVTSRRSTRAAWHARAPFISDGDTRVQYVWYASSGSFFRSTRR